MQDGRPFDYLGYIKRSFKYLKGLNPIDRKIVLYDLMDEEFHIFNHRVVGSSRPMSSVAMHPAEDFTTNSLTYQALQSYSDFDIKEFFGIDVVQYMNLPHDIVEMLNEIAQIKTSKKTTMLNEIQNNIENTQKR